jgi:hypothetical protein
MGQRSRKMNFLIEKDVEQEMERLIPAGKRSKIVNEALRRQLELMRKKSAASNLLSESAHGRRLSTAAIVTRLSHDREDH